MCRFLLYYGQEPILLADLLTRPAHSMINQSFDSRLRVDLRRPLNGDGFGVGWYNSCELHQPSEKVHPPSKNDGIQAYMLPDGPCVFTSVLPAWNNLNLIRLAEKIQSHLVFAHVRAASPGFPITETNTHPWSYGRFLFMHNGYISGFKMIKRRVQETVRDVLFHFVQGSTDSEWAFALFLNQFEDPLNGSYSSEVIKNAMLKTIEQINAFLKDANVDVPSLLNFAVTDGKTVVCSRYINHKTLEPASLYYSSGTKFVENVSGDYKMSKADRREKLVIVASGNTQWYNTFYVLEPLTHERSDWIKVPANTLLVVSPKFNVLIYPIQDNYFSKTRVTASASPNRTQRKTTTTTCDVAAWG